MGSCFLVAGLYPNYHVTMVIFFGIIGFIYHHESGEAWGFETDAEEGYIRKLGCGWLKRDRRWKSWDG